MSTESKVRARDVAVEPTEAVREHERGAPLELALETRNAHTEKAEGGTPKSMHRPAPSS